MKSVTKDGGNTSLRATFVIFKRKDIVLINGIDFQYGSCCIHIYVITLTEPPTASLWKIPVGSELMEFPIKALLPQHGGVPCSG